MFSVFQTLEMPRNEAGSILYSREGGTTIRTHGHAISIFLILYLDRKLPCFKAQMIIPVSVFKNLGHFYSESSKSKVN